MQTRFRLFSFVGIPFYVHGMLLWCLGLLAVFLFVSSDDPGATGWTLLGAVLTLACVAVHELGHALAARALGIRVHDVILHVLFGMTRMEPPGWMMALTPASARVSTPSQRIGWPLVVCSK